MRNREVYEEKLRNIYSEITKMGETLIGSLKRIETMIQEGNYSDITELVQNEELVNSLELQLEDSIILFIATEHPLAHDLRKIVSSIKIISHLERIGDYMLHLGKKYKKVQPAHLTFLQPRILRMVQTITQMLQGTLEAFQSNDVPKAEQMACLDDSIDEEHKHFLQDVFQHLSLPGNEKEFARALNLGRSIERLGDHITNICEWIVYAEQFRHVELNP